MDNVEVRRLDRAQTCQFLIERLGHERLILPRYGDGEHLLMCGGKHWKERKRDPEKRLLAAIRKPKQLVCIPTLKPHNKKDRWCAAVANFVKLGGHSRYGDASWAAHLFRHHAAVLGRLFAGRVLIVSAEAELAQSVLSPVADVAACSTPSALIFPRYEAVLAGVRSALASKSFDTVFFSAGPAGKCLLADVIEDCTADLLDIGGVLRAILEHAVPGLCSKHHMSWARKVDVREMSRDLFELIKKNNA